MNSKRASLLVTFILIISVFFAAPAAQAASPRVYISAASPSKSGYAVDEAVALTAKVKWDDLTANKTISIQLWNATDAMETLEIYTIAVNVSGVITEDGSYSGSWSPTSDLTEAVGSATFYIKVFGTDDIEIDSEAIVILTAVDQITLSVIWQDTNNDRIVGVNEGVVFTVYENWAFIETTESHALYVDWGTGTEELLDTISVTAGSGSDTTVATKGFDTAGARTVIFKLKDSTGTTVKTQSTTLNVGGSAAVTPTTVPAAGSGSVVALITGNWQLIAILGSAVIVGAVLLRKPKKGKK